MVIRRKKSKTVYGIMVSSEYGNFELPFMFKTRKLAEEFISSRNKYKKAGDNILKVKSMYPFPRIMVTKI